MSPFAPQNPGGKEGRRGSSAWEASRVQHLPFLDHWWENWAQLPYSYLMPLFEMCSAALYRYFIHSSILSRTPVNSHFPELKVKRETVTLCTCTDSRPSGELLKQYVHVHEVRLKLVPWLYQKLSFGPMKIVKNVIVFGIRWDGDVKEMTL